MQSLSSQANHRRHAAFYKKEVTLDRFRSINVPSFLPWSEFVNAGHSFQLWHHHQNRPELRLFQLRQELAQKSRQKEAALSAELVLAFLIKMQSLSSQANQLCHAAFYKKEVTLDRYRSINVPSFLLWSEFVNAGHSFQLWHHHQNRPELRLFQLRQELAQKSRQKEAALSAELVLVLLCQMLSLRPRFNQRFPVACYKMRVSLERFRSMNVAPFLFFLRAEFVNAGHIHPGPHFQLQHQPPELWLLQHHQELAWKSRQKASALSVELVLVLLCQMQSLCSQDNHRLVAAFYKMKVSTDRFHPMNVVSSFLLWSENFVNAGHLVKLWHHHPHRPVLQGLQVLQVFQLLQVLQLIQWFQWFQLLNHHPQLQHQRQ
jgi:hypothetical protein